MPNVFPPEGIKPAAFPTVGLLYMFQAVSACACSRVSIFVLGVGSVVTVVVLVV